jgi:hypothetical protein
MLCKLEYNFLLFSLAILTAAFLHLGKLAHAVVLSVGTILFE